MPAGRLPNHYLTPNNVYGLFVGVNIFDNIDGMNLRGCVNDATEMFKVFETQGECTLLVDNNATRKKILGIFTKTLAKTRKGDLFIFQVSSHGVKLLDDCYFLSFDSDRTNIMGTGIAIAPIINALSEKAKEGVKAVLILDACDSGAVSFNIAKYRGIANGGISCIFGCSPNEKAMEVPFPDDEKAKETQFPNNIYGVLAYGMLKALNGGVPDIKKKGYVNLRDMFDYSYDFVTDKSNNFRQHPLLIGTLDGNTVLKKFG